MASQVFTPDAARALDGPAWLRDRRVAAAERFAGTALPTPELETWRYSRIGDLELDRFRPVGATAATVPAAGETVRALGPAAASVVVHNGQVLGTHVEAEAAEAGVYVGTVANRRDGAELLAAAGVEAVDPFVELNEAFAADPLLVVVPRGVELAEPIVVVQHSETDATGAGAVFPRLLVVLGENASATVVEHRTSAGEVLVVPVTRLVVARDARLGYLDLQLLGPDAWQIATQQASVDAGGSLVSSTAAFGGDYARQRTDCRLAGRGAQGDLVSLYFANAQQMLDFRTFQDHAAPDTRSNLLFKGAVDDASKAVYTGLIRVRPDARGTNAFQTNRNLKLGADAWAESVPNLEIENNDVRCSHASTVGPVDPEQRFYLESRGVPPEVADRLIVAGFFDDVVSRLPLVAAKNIVTRSIGAKLAVRA